MEFVRHSRVPELPVVLLEDLAALVGLVFALFGVSLTLITGNGVWDGIGTVLIGLLLVAVAVVLAIETKSLLIGESATTEHVAQIEAAVVDGDEHRAHHPHEDPPPRTGGAARRGQGRRAAGGDARPTLPRAIDAAESASARPCRSRG